MGFFFGVILTLAAVTYVEYKTPGKLKALGDWVAAQL